MIAAHNSRFTFSSNHCCTELGFWPTVPSVVPLAHYVICLSSVVCRLSVCLSSSVTFCIVAKRYVLPKNCLKEWIGNQSQKVLGSPPYFYFRFRRYGHRDGRFCLIFARTAQRSVLDGTNGLTSSKPCVYCQIVRSELKPEVVLATIIYRLPLLVYKRVKWLIHADRFFWLTYLSWSNNMWWICIAQLINQSNRTLARPILYCRTWQKCVPLTHD